MFGMLSSLFFYNENANYNDFVPIEHKKDLVKNKIEVVELLNKFFVNAIESISSTAPTSIGRSSKPKNNSRNVKNIIYEYRNHTIISPINERC